MKYNANTPEGTRDRLFAECRERRRVQSGLTHLFRQRGYAEIITPELEFYDLFLQSGNPMPQESMLKIIDRSGKIMVMRPDSTTPIARVAATKLKDMVLPQRLYYNQSVFRSGAAHAGRETEIAQCGVELIGASGRKADLEMIALAVDALQACGLTDFHIEIGHAGFFKALAAEMGMDEEKEEEMRSLIEGKYFAALNDFLAPYEERPACRALKKLSHLFGGAEILDEAEDLGGGNGAIAYLRELYRQLDKAGYSKYIRFDLGIVHQIDYYTGVVFRGYAEGAGRAVLSGGRYDHLAAAFGRPAAATGFAVDVDEVAGCLPPLESPRLETLVHYQLGEFARAVQAVSQRPKGTAELSPYETLGESRKLARDKGAKELLILENGEERVEPV